MKMNVAFFDLITINATKLLMNGQIFNILLSNQKSSYQASEVSSGRCKSGRARFLVQKTGKVTLVEGGKPMGDNLADDRAARFAAASAIVLQDDGNCDLGVVGGGERDEPGVGHIKAPLGHFILSSSRFSRNDRVP